MNIDFFKTLLPTSCIKVQALKDIQKDVIEMNQFVGNVPNKSGAAKYFGFRKEEVGEFFEKGLEQESIAEVIDGTVDGLVVGFWERCCHVKHAEGINLYTGILEEDDREWCDSLEILEYNYTQEGLVGCARTLYSLFEIFGKMNINHKGVAEELAKSNWSKFPIEGELISACREKLGARSYITTGEASGQDPLGFSIQTAIDMIGKKGRYQNIRAERKDGRVIFWSNWDNENGGQLAGFKFVKPPFGLFQEPDFAKYYLGDK